jgi:putative phosphonate metabolism protein
MFERYAIYYTPDGALADLGARWLGWDVATGTPRAHPEVPGLDVAALTETPRRYGMHGTVKPPFRLAEARDAEALAQAARAFCEGAAPVTLSGLELATMGGFLALLPTGDTAPLRDLAAGAVRDLDAFRAPPGEAELAKRRQQSLTPAQEANLSAWGYPYVMDQFRFHITLTGRLRRADAQAARDSIAPLFEPVLPAPFVIDSLTLAGQRSDGMFVEIERLPLKG